MKKNIQLLNLFLFLMVISTFSAYSQNNTHYQNVNETKGGLSFFVRDAENEYGISSIVEITGNGKTHVLETDAGGHLLFQGTEGRYDILFSSNNHEPLRSYFFISKNEFLNVEVLLDRTIKTALQEVETNGAFVNGYVVDNESGRPMKNVSVLTGNGYALKTNDDGYFSVLLSEYSILSSDEDKPIRESFTFSHKGYADVQVTDLLLAPTSILLNITMKKGEGSVVDSYFQHVLDGTVKDVEMYEENVPEEQQDNQQKNINSVCNIPGSIRVGLNCSCTSCSSVSVMSLQTYTEKGIDNEWIPTWSSASIAAGTIAYRTYAGWYVNNPVKTNYDIASSTCNQVFGLASYANCVSAAQLTLGTILTKNSNLPVRAEYSAENNGKSAAASVSCGNCKSGTGGLYPCFTDNVCCGKNRSGHGRGMCQWGSQRWALNGKDYLWIIAHYYSIVNITMCGNNNSTACGVPTSLSASNITSTSAVLNWSSVANASSYTIQYKEVNATVWQTITSTNNSKTITGLSASLNYHFKVRAICTDTSAYSSVSSFTTTSLNSSSTVTINIGTGTSAYSAHPFGTAYMDERVQYIIDKSELVAAGWSSLNSLITSLSINVSSVSPQLMNGFSISLAHISSSVFSNTTFITGNNSTQVYSSNVSVNAGWNNYTFATPFNYNGSSNILVTICWNNSSFTSNSSVLATSYSTYKALYYRADMVSNGVCAVNSGTRSYYRPNFKLTFSSNTSLMSEFNYVENERNLTLPIEEETGVSDILLNIYPNPSNGKLIYLTLTNSNDDVNIDGASEIQRIMIYNLFGQELIDKDVVAVNGISVINTEEQPLQEGTYIVTLIRSNGLSYKKKIMVR
ncbi:MAG: fibronectin type III domain-containing protein [Bacteroidia bacterium]